MDESWTKKKSEHWITDQIVVLGDSWESLGLHGDQTSLKEINPKYLLINIYPEAEILILGPPDAKSRLTGKDSDARKEWRQKEKGVRGWDGYIVSLNSMDMNLNKLQETLKDREAFAVHGVTKNHDLATE